MKTEPLTKRHSGIASDAARNVYLAGFIADDDNISSDHWIVRRSTDGSANWTTVDDFDMGAVTWEGPTGIAVDAAADGYISGVSYVSGAPVWTIRKGVGGTSFSTVDLLTTNSHARAIF